jgi:hypothetical protein
MFKTEPGTRTAAVGGGRRGNATPNPWPRSRLTVGLDSSQRRAHAGAGAAIAAGNPSHSPSLPPSESLALRLSPRLSPGLPGRRSPRSLPPSLPPSLLCESLSLPPSLPGPPIFQVPSRPSPVGCAPRAPLAPSPAPSEFQHGARNCKFTLSDLCER